MAGTTAENVQVIIHDAKESWYFRVWAAFWCFSAVMVFAALIALSVRSGEAGHETDYHVWIENATTLEFPKFHIRLPGSLLNEKIQDVSCSHNSMFLHMQDCAPWQGQPVPPTHCRAFLTEGIYASNVWNAPRSDSSIQCSLTTTGLTTGENALIAWELEGENYAFGGNSYASMWIAPNNDSWVILSKNIIATGGGHFNEWNRQLAYHSTVSQPGKYQVRIVLNNFWVNHMEKFDSYNGWLAVADMGGYAYFMMLLLTGVMMAFGVCLNNDSTFLKGTNH